MFKSPGFTLIELMVTITIIAVLSAIGLVAYSVVIKQGRDSRRQSDLRSIQSALEQYFADQAYYPSGVSFGGSLSLAGRTYMNNVPTDPKGDTQYSYTGLPEGCDNSTTANRCNSYCISATLESVTSGASSCGGNFSVSPP